MDVAIGTLAMPSLQQVTQGTSNNADEPTSLTERLCNNGVSRCNDIDVDFDTITVCNKEKSNTAGSASQLSDFSETNIEKIRNDEADFPELE